MTWQDLDRIRKRKGLSLAEVSRIAGYGASAMARAVRGETRGSIPLWRACCEVLGVRDGEAPPPDDPLRIKAVTTWEELDQLRKELGISKKELSTRAGYRPNSFSNMMCGYIRRSEAQWRAYCTVLGVDAPVPDPTPWEQWTNARLVAKSIERRRVAREKAREGDGAPERKYHWGCFRNETPTPPLYTFTKGTRYEIREDMRGSHTAGLKISAIVTYLRKEGVHHVFRGPGGWLTTWTDPQLVDKVVTAV